MKRLYLIRHAKSSWMDLALLDIERPLNKRGEKDAPFMGKRLKKFKVSPDVIYSSPAKRALTTAKTIAGEVSYPEKKIIVEEEIYGSGTDDLLKLIQSIDDKNMNAIIFGHNPEFTMLAGILTGNEISNIPTCGIYCIDFDVNSWKDIEKQSGEKVFFDFPKKHK